MPLSQRAKIFIPFDPLHGFQAALREKEREAAAVAATPLSPEQSEKVDRVLRGLALGNEVVVQHNKNGELRVTHGRLEALSLRLATLAVGDVEVAFADIRDIERA